MSMTLTFPADLFLSANWRTLSPDEQSAWLAIASKTAQLGRPIPIDDARELLLTETQTKPDLASTLIYCLAGRGWLKHSVNGLEAVAPGLKTQPMSSSGPVLEATLHDSAPLGEMALLATLSAYSIRNSRTFDSVVLVDGKRVVEHISTCHDVALIEVVAKAFADAARQDRSVDAAKRGVAP